MSGEPDAPLSDTSPEIEALLLARWRAMSPADKWRRISDQICSDDGHATVGILRGHPHADERELTLRLASLKYDRELMLAAFGWDPRVEGY
ncbi:MAG TPA: hypothetical protein VK824_04885 [Planctomycetota bacterium]|nr:hypothetical protein [Planctomycetota bacterium]